MYDKEFVHSVLTNVDNSINMIIYRFNKIISATDFVKNNDGLEVMDSISMRLQFIGESLKKIEKSNKEFFKKYPGIEWDKIINLRDFISHHYEMLNHEIIFDICSNHIPKLKKELTDILADLIKPV